MLTGKQVRVRVVRNKLTPLYLKPTDPALLGVAEQLLYAYRDAAGRTRGEIEAELADLLGEGPGQLVHQGLAKLLDEHWAWLWFPLVFGPAFALALPFWFE